MVKICPINKSFLSTCEGCRWGVKYFKEVPTQSDICRRNATSSTIETYRCVFVDIAESLYNIKNLVGNL